MQTLRYIGQNWERILFALVGLACFVFGFIFVFQEKIAHSSAVFAVGFFGFLYSNLARFKRFKGLGFEAELWEDKQKEAADLIDRLKNVVAIYSREVVMGQVMRGRLGGVDWQKNWALFNELVEQHGELGQTIDFSELKAQIDHVFLFDMCHAQASVLERSFNDAKSKSREVISAEFGKPIRDVEGYSARVAQLNSISFSNDDLFDNMRDKNVPEILVTEINTAIATFQRDFGVTLSINEVALQNLAKIAGWYANRPLDFTAEMIRLTKDRSEI